MPKKPKQAREQPGDKKKKKEEAFKQKKNEDKVKVDPTFGLKNKKGSRNRQFVTNSKKNMNAEQIQRDQERFEKKQAKEMQRRLQREEDALFTTVDTDESKLKKKKANQNEEDEEEKVEIDDETLLNECDPDELDQLIDQLRTKFESRTDLTPVNADTFGAWMQRKAEEAQLQQQDKLKKKMQKEGKKGLSGRELFSLNPTLFVDDENADASITYAKQEEEQTAPANDANNTQSQADDANGNTNTNVSAANEIGDASLFLDMDDLGAALDMELID